MSEDSTIDPATIATLRDLSPGDDSFLQEIIGIFLNDSPVRLQEIRDGIKANDAKLVTRAAHSLKGSSGNFGAKRMQAASKDIEQLAGAGKLGEAAAHLPTLEAEYDAVAKALRALK
jgi:HPt (histidine-containing phosphotransfer) domain-containing protein